MNTYASRYFVMFRPMVKDLLNIEQKTEMYIFFKLMKFKKLLVLLDWIVRGFLRGNFIIFRDNMGGDFQF